MSGIASSHHVLGVKHLLCQFRDSQGPVLLAASGSEGRKPRHEKVETREWNHVDSKLSKISVELTREPKASGNTRHGQGDQMVQVSISGSGQLEGSEADIIQSFIVNAEGFISIFDQLMNGEGGIVGLDNSVGHLGGRHDGVGVHDPVWVFLSDLGDEECSHTRASSSSKRVSQLKSLQTVAGFRFLTDDVQN